MKIHVVGAGPAGLTLALRLSSTGHEVVVHERLPELSRAWRASTFHAATLDLLSETSGVLVDRMHERGLVAREHRVHDRTGGLIATFDFAEIREETRHPYRLQLEQYKYSEILLEMLQTSDQVEVRFNSELVFDASEFGTARDAETGRDHVLDGFIVGADGASSAVRKSLGIEFPGMTYPQKFLISSVDGPVENLRDDLGPVNYIWDAQDPSMILRIPDLWRIMFQVEPETRIDDWEHSMRTRLEALAPRSASALHLHSGQVYSVHQRVAESFAGPSWALVGDAAHVNSPIGGMGLNSGILDALHLGHLLAGATPPDEAALTEYSRIRRACALDYVQRVTRKNTSAMFETDDAARRRNIAEIEEIVGDESRRKDWLREASMLDARATYFDQALPSEKAAL